MTPTLLLTIIFTATLGVQQCVGQAERARVEEKKFYQLTNKQALAEAGHIVEGLKYSSERPGQAAAGSPKVQQAIEASAEELAEEEQVKEDRVTLQRLRQQLALDDSVRNLPKAVEGYLALYERLKLSLAVHPPRAADDEDGDASSSEEDSGDNGSDLGDKETHKTTKNFKSLADADPSLEPLGAAAFELAVLTLSGLAGSVWKQNETLGVEMLGLAAEAGSLDAHLALSNRRLIGIGIRQDCDLAFLHGKEAAEVFIDQAESAGAFQPPVDPVLLRDRFRNADFLMPLPGLLHQAGQQDALGAEPLDGVNLFEFMHRDQMDGEFGGWQWLQGMPLASQEESTVEMLRRLAAQGDGEALFNLGYMHMRGIEVEQNATAAYMLFTAAMLKGSPAAYNALGVMYHNGQHIPVDYTTARQMFEAGALLGDVDSMFNLGTLHLAGHGVEKDAAAALKYFQDANDHQHWQAPYQLALMYQRGNGTEKNCKKAAQHLNTFLVERAPWHDDIYSAVRVLDAGDEWKGLMLLALVAEQGSTAGQHNLAFALETSKTFQLPERYALAVEMYLRSGAAGYFAPGLTDAAHLIWDGHKYPLLTDTNRSWALTLYEEASRQGDVEATFYLGRVHEGEGAVTKRNATKAAELYWKAVLMSPSERFAAAPLLALFLLRLQGYRRLLIWLLSGGSRRAPHWDLAVLSALASGLAAVLWMRWQRRRPMRQQREPSSGY